MGIILSPVFFAGAKACLLLGALCAIERKEDPNMSGVEKGCWSNMSGNLGKVGSNIPGIRLCMPRGLKNPFWS